MIRELKKILNTVPLTYEIASHLRFSDVIRPFLGVIYLSLYGKHWLNIIGIRIIRLIGQYSREVIVLYEIHWRGKIRKRRIFLLRFAFLYIETIHEIESSSTAITAYAKQITSESC